MPWIAPRLDMVRISGDNPSNTETNFGLSSGIEFNLLNGFGLHAAYDRVFLDGEDPRSSVSACITVFGFPDCDCWRLADGTARSFSGRLVSLTSLVGCAQTFDATTLGVPVTMASPAGQAVEGAPFSVTGRAVYAFWGVAKLKQPSLRKAHGRGARRRQRTRER